MFASLTFLGRLLCNIGIYTIYVVNSYKITNPHIKGCDNMIKGAIFDLDGTLLNSMHAWFEAGEKYLKSQNTTPRNDLTESIKSMSLRQAAEYLKQQYQLAKTTDEIIAGITNTVKNSYKYDIMLKDGAKSFLEKLSLTGVKMCIATASERSIVEAALDRLDIKKYFIAILTCDEVGHGKDEPIIYREALKLLGTTKENTYIFEDACHAIKTAKADGFKVVAVYDSFEAEQEKIKSICDYYTTDYNNLTKL